ncbi:AMP-binding protein [Alsobacter sp. SYSU M60028]|uniref:AMP-binding protein n=1 Tax=Alsobacter ponti TaxID=2962936 RepID=A0ABT1LG38_9HYPH|nr:AMP-binding protein [Alsobacter ponti]MCP8940469.1 AMP-binding protein [Alsobacter ponti]
MTQFDPATTRQSLFQAILDASRRFGPKTPIVEDPERSPLNYGRLILAALVLGRKLVADARPGEPIGVLLPNVNAVAVTLVGLWAHGRVAAMLNFTSGLANLRSAVATAEIRTIVTSRRFVEQGKLDEIVSGLAEADPAAGRPAARIVYLEDVRQSVTSLDKALGVLATLFAGMVHRRHARRPDDPAVILFTSGSEGRPKAVVLSSANLLANVRQIEAHIGSPPLGPAQVMLNALPVFHSYGLTGGVLLPLLSGMKAVLYPSPLHFRQVPRLCRAVQATILLGTDTFLQGWARAAEPGDLDSVRFVVAGAERVRDQTRDMWGRFGTLILEGYGATECSPVIAVNQPAGNRPGTVGQMLPGIETRQETVEGLAEGQRLLVRGPNVMLGYMLADRPGVLVPPPDGWHDTGDIVGIDDEGFVRILGRAKRFAKIGGEMVSLGAIETLAAGLWPGATHVAVTLPDVRKGEQIVLVTDMADADRSALLAYTQDRGYPELWVPKAILVTASVPVMANGKVDFFATQELAASMRPML